MSVISMFFTNAVTTVGEAAFSIRSNIIGMQQFALTFASVTVFCFQKIISLLTLG